MKITRDSEEGIVILRMDGKLTIGVGDVRLREAIGEALDDGHQKILLDLAGLKTMDSSGLGELIRAKGSASDAGATIKLLHVEDKVQEVLEMTRLIGVFENFDDEIDAIASFRG